MSNNQLVDLLNQSREEHTIIETGQVVGIRPITTGLMKKILGYEGEENPDIVETILDEIILGCVDDESFNLDSLTLQDRFELLIHIRRITKGNTYTFNIICPKCGSESIQCVNIPDLEMKPYVGEKDKVRIGDRIILTLDYVRRGAQKEAASLVNGMGKKLTETQRKSEIATYLYALSISDVGTKAGSLNNITVKDKYEFLDKLGEADYDSINDWYDKYNYGTIFKFSTKCSAGCGHTEEMDIPLTGFFF